MRYMAPELYSICDEENEDTIPRVTVATDVWGYAMTIIEVSVSVSIILLFFKLVG